MKIFKEYSKAKKRDKNKYGAAYRELIPVVILALIKVDLVVFQYVCAIIDFVYMVYYKSYTNQTLEYIKHAFYQINQSKKTFKYIY